MTEPSRFPVEAAHGPLRRAAFLRRPNRYVAEVQCQGELLRCHVPDPGRLLELLYPGNEVWIRDAAPEAAHRVTRHTVLLARAPEPPHALVSLDTGAANRLAEALLRSPHSPFGRVDTLRREVRAGARSRLDFLLERRGRLRYVEVKSVSLVEEGRALFPDAVSARATRHLQELVALRRAGFEAAVLFVLQRHDARSVRPHDGRDPVFAEALRAARRAGVQLRAAAFEVTEHGSRYTGRVPVVT